MRPAMTRASALSRLLWALGLALLPGCRATPDAATPDAPTPDSGPDWLQQTLARESEPAAENTLEGPEAAFTARVAGSPVGDFEPAEISAFVAIEIGTGVPVECHFYREEMEFAGFLQSISKALFQEVEAAHGSLDVKRIVRIDAGAVGSAPYLALDWLIRFGQAVGHLKQFMGSVDGRSIYCLHDQAGYVRSFERFFKGMLGTIRFADSSSPTPYFREIVVFRTGGLNAGFQSVSMTRDEEGDVRIDHSEALLLPSSPESLHATDGVGVEWSRPDGTLLNQYFFESQAGVQVTNLRLRPAESFGWKVEGTFQGQPVEGDFETESPLVSMLGEYRLFRRLSDLGDPAEPITYRKWNPGTSLFGPVEHSLELREGSGKDTVPARLLAGPLVGDLEIDDRGVRSARYAVGSTTMEVNRVFVDGSF
jgi:hypothetical protein